MAATVTDADLEFLAHAVRLAEEAEAAGNVPVGALLVVDGQVVAEGRNAVLAPEYAPGRHAEIEALRAAPAEVWQRPRAVTCYSTLEPCLMCGGSLILHGVGRVVFGALDPDGGARHVLPHLPPYYGGGRGVPEWVGPGLPERCDPLYRRALERFQGLPCAVDQGPAVGEVLAETPRLYLRTWTLEDVPAGLRIWGDPEVMRFVDGGRPEDEAEVRASIAAGIRHQQAHGCQHWAVVEKASDQLIGCAGFHLFEGGPDLELVVHFAREWWGRGLAQEACRAAIQLAWERLRAPRLVCGVHPDNHPSRRLVEALGFTQVGVHQFEDGDEPEPFFELRPPPR